MNHKTVPQLKSCFSRIARASHEIGVPFSALIVFFSQQVFNPNLSMSEWNLAEMEASLSPVRDTYFWDNSYVNLKQCFL